MLNGPSGNVDHAALGEERFFKLSSDLLCIANSAGYFLRLSESWTRVLGYSLKELTSRPYLDFIHPDDRPTTIVAASGHVNARQVMNFTNRFRSVCGEYRTLSWRSSPVDHDGLIFAVARDVTEEVEATRQLAAERARLQAIMDAIPDLLFIKDKNYNYIGCNNQFASFLETSENDLHGKSDFELFPADVAKIFRDNDAAIFSTGRIQRNTEWIPYQDKRRIFETIKAPLTDGAGHIIGVVGVARDITQQMELRSEIDFLGAQVNLSRDPLYCLRPDDDFKMAYVNDAACEFFGMTRDEIIGMSVSRIDPTMTPARQAEFWTEIRAARTAVIFSTDIHRPDGTIVPAEVSANHIRHQDEDYIVGWIRDISPRREAERRLREREAFYRAAVEAANDGFWLVSRDGHILDVNSAYARMSGYTQDELRGMTISEVEALEQAEDIACRIERIFTQGASSFESRHRRKDGSVWDIEADTLYSDIEGGRIFVFIRDSRRRRRAEALLKTRLQLSEICRRGDMDALITAVLEAAERLTASTLSFLQLTDSRRADGKPQVWTRNIQADMSPADREKLRYAIAANPETAVAAHLPTIRMLTAPAAGESGVAAVIGVGNKSGDYEQEDIDTLTELSGVAIDAMQWLMAERSQRELTGALTITARQWTAAMNSFEGGVAVLDSQHRLVRANAAFFAFTASTPDRLGQKVVCLPPGDTPLLDCPLCEAFSSAKPAQMVLEPGAPGNPSGLPLELRVTPIREDDSGDGLLLSLYDLSQVREQERRMQQTIAELTDSNAELEQFAKVAAHDLQEPTRRQISYSQLLERKLEGALDEEARAYLDYIIEDARRMRNMVRELNVYCEAGRTLRPQETVDMDAVLADVLAALSPEIQASGARLRFTSLGPALGNRSRLQLLLVNIISNALKFRRPDTPPDIDISSVQDGGWLRVAVADNGVGIAEEYRADLFTLFRRVGRGRQLGGAGMGLAQCRRIVDDLGGRIWIEGNDVGGATVKFTLPRAV